MACEDCRREQVAQNVDGLYQDTERLERVQRNQAYLLIALAVVVVVLLIRLNDKGILSYKDLLDAPVG
jgi:hypothetical protein